MIYKIQRLFFDKNPRTYVNPTVYNLETGESEIILLARSKIYSWPPYGVEGVRFLLELGQTKTNDFEEQKEPTEWRKYVSLGNDFEALFEGL